MNPTELDVFVPGQVESRSSVTADLGGGRSLVVLSGIACPEYNAVDDEQREATWRVLLHEQAETMESWTAHVGLASISNDDSSWVFATDKVDLLVENGELVLQVHLVVRGDSSFLHRFSYQVVLTRRLVVTEISGTLSWPTARFRPASADPTTLVDVFSVTASTVDFSGPAPVFTVVARGIIETVTIADDVCHASYRIVGAPKGQVLSVNAEQLGALGPPAVYMSSVIPGYFQFSLTSAQPTRTDVDFVAKVDRGVS